MMTISIVVYGNPAPQGSKRAFINRFTGRAALQEMSDRVKPWRESVKHDTLAAMGRESSPVPAISGPCRVIITFTVAKPKSAPKTRRTYPATRPDLDKLVRSTCDGLTSAGAYEDDSRVVELIATKAYPNESAGALDRPGAVIRIEAIA